MSFPQQPKQAQVEFIVPKDPHALSGRRWIPIPATEPKFEVVHIMWQYPGSLDVGRVKSSLRMVLGDYPHWAGRLARESINDDGLGTRASESGWRIELNTEGVQFSVARTRHPGIFRAGYQDDDLNADFYEELELPDPDLKGIHPYPLMKVRLTHWELTGDTSITITHSHVVGDAPTMMRLMESWSTYYQGLTPTWKPTFEKYLTPSPATAKTLPLEYVTTAVPYMGFLAVDHSLDYMIDGVENMTKSSKRIDLKFTSKTLYKLLEMVLRTSPEIDDASRKLSLTDLLSAYLVYVLQRVLDTKIVQVQQTFGYRGMKSPSYLNILDTYAAPPATSAGNCFLIVSAKERLDGTESVGKIASIFRGTIAELRQPELFQQTFAVYSCLYKRIADNLRFPMELPTETAVQVNTISKLPVLQGHFGYPGRVRMYHWDSYQNFFEIVPANPVRTPSGTWISYDGGVDVFVRIRRDIVAKYLRKLAEDMKADGLGEVMTASGAQLRESSKL